jgi:hypothetical protein
MPYNADVKTALDQENIPASIVIIDSDLLLIHE